jgi:shikimate kinase
LISKFNAPQTQNETINHQLTSHLIAAKDDQEKIKKLFCKRKSILASCDAFHFSDKKGSA